MTLMRSPTRENHQGVSTNTLPAPPPAPERSKSSPKLNNDIHDEALDDINLENFKKQQETIEKTLNYLLNVKIKKRKQGRPKANSTPPLPPKIPDTISDELRAVNKFDEIHPGVLLDFLNKINDFNKKILTGFDLMSKKYDQLTCRLDRLNCSAVNISTGEGSRKDSPEDCTTTSPQSEPPKSTTYEDRVTIKLDEIEQKSNANVVLCSGSFISNICNNEENLNNDNITTNVINIISDKLIPVTRKDIVKVNRIGKNRNLIKITCSSESLKIKLISEARKQKIPNIYLNEYLTKFRNKLFFQARKLRLNNHDRLKVYTRHGDIFYKLRDGRPKIVKTLQDIHELTEQLSSS